MELAERVGPALHRYAARRTDPDTAEDVVSETLLVMWRRLDDVPAEDPLPWCYAVARGCLANATRSARRQQRVRLRLASMTREESQDVPDPAGDPRLAHAWVSLTPTEREVLRLWAWEELAPREIAVVLGTTPNAVSIRLHRARARLGELIGSDLVKDQRPSRTEGGDIT